MKFTRPLSAAVALGGLVLAIAACSSDNITAPATPASMRAVASRDAAAPTAATGLLACPVDSSASATAVIGPRGGSVSVGRFELSVPPHAVPEPTTFTFDVPASQYLEVDVHVPGLAHYEFARPVHITLDYARCGSDFAARTFDAWYIDSATSALIAPMRGHDDKGRALLIFSTDHLSRYAIAD